MDGVDDFEARFRELQSRLRTRDAEKHRWTDADDAAFNEAYRAWLRECRLGE